MFKKLIFFLPFVLLAQGNPVHQQISTLQAENYWKYHHWASVGYRRDRQKFQANTTQSTYTDRNTMQLILGSHAEWYKVVLHFVGSYGWLVNGNFGFQDPPVSGKYDLGAGYTADVAAELGLRIPIYNHPSFSFAFIPSGGYKYSHLMNFAESKDPTYFPKPNQQDWFGPLIEGRLDLLFSKVCEWALFYQYHWVTMRSKSTEQQNQYGSTTTLSRWSSIYKASYAQKQVIGTDIRYHTSSGWYSSIHFEASKFTTAKATYNSKQVTEQVSPLEVTTVFFNEPASILWVCYDVSLSLGYQF